MSMIQLQRVTIHRIGGATSQCGRVNAYSLAHRRRPCELAQLSVPGTSTYHVYCLGVLVGLKISVGGM